MKSKVKNLILKQAIKYIVWFSKDSNYVKHALSEFDIAWGEKDEMQDFMCKQVIELLSLLSTHGDSGFSIGYKLNLFDKLVPHPAYGPIATLLQPTQLEYKERCPIAILPHPDWLQNNVLLPNEILSFPLKLHCILLLPIDIL